MKMNHEKYKSIVHINTNDARGGAAKFALRLSDYQRDYGIDSKVLVGFKDTKLENIYLMPINQDLVIYKKCMEEGKLYYDISGSHRLVSNQHILEADIVHLHNLHGGYFNTFSLPALTNLKPTVWTLHDMYAFTGHCATAMDCRRWETGCGDCPDLLSYPSIFHDSTSELIRDKKLVYDSAQLQIVVPSKWLYEKASKSILKDQPIEIVHHGIDLRVFKPYDNNFIRKKYGIPEDRIIIGSAAYGGAYNSKNKGGEYIKSCLKVLAAEEVNFVFINVGSTVESNDGSNIINMGYISDETELAQIFSGFDIFLFPSLAETFGLVALEALACGVPVIAFDTGAIKEIVSHGINGFTADYRSETQLIAYLKLLINDIDLRRQFSNEARKAVLENFEYGKMAEKYNKIYEKCLSNHNKVTISKYFLDHIPDLIKNDLYFSYNCKTNEEGIQNKVSEKDYKVAVLYDSYGSNIKKSETYESLLSQVYKNIKIVKLSGEVLVDEIDSDTDLVYWISEGYLVDENLLLDIVNGYGGEDITCSMIIPVRENGKIFYKTIFTDVIVKEDEICINSQKHSGIVFGYSYFMKNMRKILQRRYVSVNTYNFINHDYISVSISWYIIDLLHHIKNKKIYIYGAGTHTVDLLNSADFSNVNICGIIDKNHELEGSKISGFTVNSFNNIKELEIDYILISSMSFESEIFEQLGSFVEIEKLIRVYGKLY